MSHVLKPEITGNVAVFHCECGHTFTEIPVAMLKEDPRKWKNIMLEHRNHVFTATVGTEVKYSMWFTKIIENGRPMARNFLDATRMIDPDTIEKAFARLRAERAKPIWLHARYSQLKKSESSSVV